MKVSMNLDSVSCSLGSLVRNSTINMVAGEEAHLGRISNIAFDR